MATGKQAVPGGSAGARRTLAWVAAVVVLLASSAFAIADRGIVRADDCWALTLQANPPEGGSISVMEGHQGACPSGQYVDGTTYQVEATPNPGWRVASVSGGDPVPGFPNRVIGIFSGPVTTTATFARELSHGVTSAPLSVPQGSWHYFAIDVPAGASGLTVAMAGTNDADLRLRHGSLPTQGAYDCGSFLASSSDSCPISEPAQGAWYVAVEGFSAETAVVTLTATIDACWEVQVQSEPPGIPIQVTPAQNCPGGYQHGTDVTFTANPPLANPFTDWRVGGVEQNTTNPLTLDITGGMQVVGDFATPMTDGQDLQDQYFPPGVHRAFYVDVPAGTGRLRFSLQPTGGAIEPAGYELAIGTPLVCANGITAGNSGDCIFGDPPAGRMWLVAASNDGATVDIQAEVERCVQVNIAVSPPGSGSVEYDPPMTCTGGYLEGESITMTAVPAQGYAFASWGPNLLLPNNPLPLVVAGTDINQSVYMALGLSSGVESNEFTGPGESWFYIDVPIGAAKLTVTTSDSSDDLAVTEEFLEGSLCPSEPGNTCVMEPPYAARWFIRVKKSTASPSTVIAVVVRCHELTLTAHPAGAGTLAATPANSDGCMPGWYKRDTVVELTASANPGYAFALWDGPFFATANPYLYQIGESSNSFFATFGEPLDSGVPRTFSSPEASRYYMAYIDVPPGTGVLRVTTHPMSRVRASALGMVDGPSWSFDCVRFEPLPDSAECSTENPAPGRWWLGAVAKGTGDITVSATLDDAPLCHTITADMSPATASPGLVKILTPPNCDGGRYQHGTVVYYDVAEQAPGLALKTLRRNGDEVLNSGSFEIYEHTTFAPTYAERIPLGTTSDIVIPPSGARNFFFDTPAEADQIFLAIADGIGITASLESTPLFCSITPAVPPGSGGCGIGGLDGPKRWWVTLTGSGATPDITITVSPEMAGVIDYLSPADVFKGSPDIVLSVHGYGFTPGSTVYFDDVALPTTFVSANLLTATVPAIRLAGAWGKYDVVVHPPGGGTLRVPTIPSNVAAFSLQRRSSDANCDATTGSDDALAVLRYLAGFDDDGYCEGDANVDGVVTVADALWIRGEIAGLIDPQPAR